MKTVLYNQKAKKVGEVDLDKEVFGLEPNQKVISQYVFSYLSNQREGNANTKIISEVRGSGRKPWRQKGTGRARVGSVRSPLWRKGGIVFGPRSDRNWKKRMTKNFKIAAMKNVLSLAAKTENFMFVVDKISVDAKEKLTKQAQDIAKSFDTKKFLIITSEVNKDVLNAFSNLKNASVSYIGEVNAYDIFRTSKVIVEKDALEAFNKWLKKEKNDN